MNSIRILIILLVSATASSGQESEWKALDKVARSTLAKGQQQTQLAIIGEIQAPEGKHLVATQRIVTEGMLAPRGQLRLLLFNLDGKIAADYGIIDGEPLWCEKSRIYVAGNGLLRGVAVDPRITEMYPESAEGGNVFDFSKGVSKPLITRERKYGSSGGIEDDPWKKK